MSPRFVTSTASTATRSPSWFARSSVRLRARSRIAPRAPSSTNRSTIARPSPDAPPVTSATLFSSQPISEKVTQVARQQHRLFEKNLAICDLERSFDSPQQVSPRSDPRALLRVKPGAVNVEVRLDFELAAAIANYSHIGDQMTRARGWIFRP